MFAAIHRTFVFISVFCVGLQGYTPDWKSLDSRPLPSWYDEAKVGIFIHWGLFSVPSFGSEWFWAYWKIFCVGMQGYTPDWKSLDSRPLPSWYDEAKVGIFIHWGLFSVPSFGSEWFWQHWKDGLPKYVDFMKKNYRPGFSYQDFAPEFRAEFYDPHEWANIFNASGARYVVLTSKHHEGFTMWPSKYSWGWNSWDCGPGRDLLGELAVALSKYSEIKFGVYHSLYEWFNPLYVADKANGFKTDKFVTSKTLPELYELVEKYHPHVVWSDGDWEANDTYWKARDFLAWLFTDSVVKDTVVVNDRWGFGIPCHHGSFYNCKDRFNPGVLQKHKWENCMTIDSQSWGYRREAKFDDFLTIEDILKTMAETVSCGGNLLINVGPRSDGKIAPIMEERLRQMGKWLSVNGEAIYKSQAWTHQNDTYSSGVWYTKSGSTVYAIVLKWPQTGSVILGSVSLTSDSKITLIGYDKKLKAKNISKGAEIVYPAKNEVKSDWAWVLKMKNIKAK